MHAIIDRVSFTYLVYLSHYIEINHRAALGARFEL